MHSDILRRPSRSHRRCSSSRRGSRPGTQQRRVKATHTAPFMHTDPVARDGGPGPPNGAHWFYSGRRLCYQQMHSKHARMSGLRCPHRRGGHRRFKVLSRSATTSAVYSLHACCRPKPPTALRAARHRGVAALRAAFESSSSHLAAAQASALCDACVQRRTRLES